MKARLACAALAVLSTMSIGCGKKGGEVTVKGSQKEEVVRIAEPIVDSLMATYNSGDYEQHVKDFEARVKEEITPERFEKTRRFIMDRIGTYLKRSAPDVKARGPNLVFTYKADFEKEQGVHLKVVFHTAGKELRVASFRLISPTLQQ